MENSSWFEWKIHIFNWSIGNDIYICNNFFLKHKNLLEQYRESWNFLQIYFLCPINDYFDKVISTTISIQKISRRKKKYITKYFIISINLILLNFLLDENINQDNHKRIIKIHNLKIIISIQKNKKIKNTSWFFQILNSSTSFLFFF